MQHSRGMVRRQMSEEHGHGLIASIVGPLGVILRGIAGAGGGWWASNRAAWSFEDLSEDDEALSESSPTRPATAR